MSGKWHAYVPTTVGKRDQPCVTELAREHSWCHPTRQAALEDIRRKLEREHLAAREKVAELGRALASLAELEEKP
jgi:hypothetical protein